MKGELLGLLNRRSEKNLGNFSLEGLESGRLVGRVGGIVEEARRFWKDKRGEASVEDVVIMAGCTLMVIGAFQVYRSYDLTGQIKLLEGTDSVKKMLLENRREISRGFAGVDLFGGLGFTALGLALKKRQ